MTGAPYQPDVYQESWKPFMDEATQLFGGGEGWTNTVDNNNVTQARLIAHWDILLSGKIPEDTLQSILKQIGQTQTLEDYKAIHDNLIAQVEAALPR